MFIVSVGLSSSWGAPVSSWPLWQDPSSVLAAETSGPRARVADARSICPVWGRPQKPPRHQTWTWAWPGRLSACWTACRGPPRRLTGAGSWKIQERKENCDCQDELAFSSSEAAECHVEKCSQESHLNVILSNQSSPVRRHQDNSWNKTCGCGNRKWQHLLIFGLKCTEAADPIKTKREICQEKSQWQLETSARQLTVNLCYSIGWFSELRSLSGCSINK